ncbi:MAG: OmpA family protein [Halieaceae bacterium]
MSKQRVTTMCGSRAAGLCIAALSALLLAACSNISEEDAPTPARVESATPTWSRGEPAPAPAPAATRTTKAKAKTPAFTRLDPESGNSASAEHKQALLSTESGVLDTDEIGYYMDTQEARLIQLLGNSEITIKREGNDITLLIGGGNVFASNQSRLTPGAREMLQPVAEVLEEYSNTRISIYGHTDDQGEADYNQQLSERRASSIARQLAKVGVARERIAIIGYGASQPIASNATEEGRDRNRRIELFIEPLARAE